MNKVFNILFTGKLLQTIDMGSLGARRGVTDIAVYRDKVFLACGDGLRRYTIKY